MCRKLRSFLLFLSLLGSVFAWAQKKQDRRRSYNLDQELKIKVSPELRERVQKIRVRNQATGEEAIIELGDDKREQLSSDWLKSFDKQRSKKFVPVFSYLDYRRLRSAPMVDPMGAQRDHARSLIFDQPVWMPLSYQVQESGRQITFMLGYKIMPRAVPAPLRPVAPDPALAAQRRKLKEAREYRRMFELGWQHYQDGRYDLAKEAFEKIVRREDLLDPAQLAQAHLGLGISTFHQSGCYAAEPLLAKADRDEKNRDDVSYFRALCLVEKEKFADAGKLFQELLSKQHPLYSENSRFYLGVVYEGQERYSEAKGFYLDTIDFAEDTQLVDLAKERLRIVEQKEADLEYRTNWFTTGLSVISGFDTNVVSASSSITPESLSISSKSGFSVMGVVFVDANLPWHRSFQHRLRYTGVAMHYQREDLSKTYDMQNHDATMLFAFNSSDSNRWSVSGSFNSTFIGPFRTSYEFLQSYIGKVAWTHVVGSVEAPRATLDQTFSFAKQNQKTGSDSDGWMYAINGYYNFLHKAPHVFGPGWKFSYSDLLGSSSKNYSAALTGKWDFPIFEDVGVNLNQELGVQSTFYTLANPNRRDYMLTYTGGLSKAWTKWLETRLQTTWTSQFSNQSAYQYNKMQFNLMLNAIF